jgi:hypothetical protein
MQNANKNHCVNGHAFDLENTYIWPKTGKRICRVCQIERIKKSRQKAKNERAKRVAEERAHWISDLSERELAWAAGLFEGEGTVTITKAGRRGYARPVVSVTSTDAEIVGFFQERWRANLRSVGSVSNKAKEAFEWRLYSSWKIELFINQILPFILTSRVRNKMQLVFDACRERQQGTRDPGYKAKRDDLRMQVRKLNQRGV